MDIKLPTFTGYGSDEEIIRFFKQLEVYFAAKVTTLARKLQILDAVVQGPAREVLQDAITNNTNNARYGIDAEQYRNQKNYIIQEYYTKDIKQGIKDQILVMVQRITEIPRLFYARLRHAAELAGYATNAVKEQVVSDAFL